MADKVFTEDFTSASVIDLDYTTLVKDPNENEPYSATMQQLARLVNNLLVGNSSLGVEEGTISLTLNGTTFNITIGNATSLENGLMSAEDKAKLDAIEEVENYELPIASASTLGGIKVGANLSIGSDGTLNATAGSYTLPTATNAILGGVKVGSGLSVDLNGVLTTNDIVSVSRFSESSEIALSPTYDEYGLIILDPICNQIDVSGMTRNRWYKLLLENNNDNVITINGIQAEDIIDNRIDVGGQLVSSYIEMMFVSDLGKLIIKN